MVQDPVCGMKINENDAAASTEYKRKVYYFCSPSCQDAFEKEPEKYVKNDGGEMKHHH
jgi:YHS domain-containing protein